MPFGSVKVATSGIWTGFSAGYFSSLYAGITAAEDAGGFVSGLVWVPATPARRSAIVVRVVTAFLLTGLRPERMALQLSAVENRRRPCGYWLRNTRAPRAVHPRRLPCRCHRSK